jgi:hypothetical protein
LNIHENVDPTIAHMLMLERVPTLIDEFDIVHYHLEPLNLPWASQLPIIVGPMQRRNRHVNGGQATTTVLLVLAGITLVCAALKAGGLWPRRATPTPRQIVEEFYKAGRSIETGQTSAPIFTDVAPALGIQFAHDNAARGNFLLPEEMGPGVALLDVDNDGDLDIFVAGGGAIVDDGPPQSCRLYRNDGASLTDITERATANVPGPAYGVACADVNNDGYLDIYITRLGRNVLLHNNGDGTFSDMTEQAGVGDPGFGASAVFFDYDMDGWLDLYVTNYVNWAPEWERTCFSTIGLRDYCTPTAYNGPSVDRLYHNLGHGRFEDVTQRAGMAEKRGNGLGVVAEDFDGDGWVDLYVANDMTPAFLWKNNGNGTFEEVAQLHGCAYDARGVAISGMGVATQDFDGDGDWDLFVTNIDDQTHLVLENDGHGYFTDVSLRMGLALWSIPVTGFGIAMFDQDSDGRLDVFIANGAVNIIVKNVHATNPFAQPAQFIRLVNGKFVDVSAMAGVKAFNDIGRGVACGDIDNDGDLDLVLTNNGGPLRVLRNNADHAHAWLMVDPRHSWGSRRIALPSFNARVQVRIGQTVLRRTIQSGGSYLSSSDHRAHFGLGAAKSVDQLQVTWPDGRKAVRTNVPANQVVIIQPDE